MAYHGIRARLSSYFFNTDTASKGIVPAPDHADDLSELSPHHRIRLLSFNIQVGIHTSAYRHYLTKGWQHVLPHAQRRRNLDRIACLLRHFDIIGLQEADGGSFRSGFVNQVEYLAAQGGFPFWHQQLNRDFGRVAQHSNGILSRYKPLEFSEHKLPGLIPGRGVVMLKLGAAVTPLVVVMMHLSLGRRTQRSQLAFVKELVSPYEHVVLMGDMNTHTEELLGDRSPLRGSHFKPVLDSHATFPSWRPERGIDHILVSESLRIRNAGVVNFPLSDHLPVALDVALPAGRVDQFTAHSA